MKIFNSIRVRTPGQTCQTCAWFQNDPAFIEAAYPGLTAMSSGFASVRDHDGFCNYNQLYLSARDTCPHFAQRAEINQGAANIGCNPCCVSIKNPGQKTVAKRFSGNIFRNFNQVNRLK